MLDFEDEYAAYMEIRHPMIWRTAVIALMYSSVVIAVLRVSMYVLNMATLVELQKEIHQGLAVRRPSYPEGRFVWDRGDGLLVTSGAHGRVMSKTFSMEEILAADWVPVLLPMFHDIKRTFTLRVPEFHRKKLPKTFVPMRDIPAMALTLLVVGCLGYLWISLL